MSSDLRLAARLTNTCAWDSVNTLKRVCRKLNIPKWPYREVSLLHFFPPTRFRL
jgi:hypothetical protein